MVRVLSKLLIFGLIAGLSACNLSTPASGLRIRVVVDGQTKVLSAAESISVSQLLNQNNITLDSLDLVDPPGFTQVSDNMTITVTRVHEEQQCSEKPLPFDTVYVPKPDLAPDETRTAQSGQDGKIKVCYSVTFYDGAEKNRIQGPQTILATPQNQIILKGIPKPEPVAIAGMLAYISDGGARLLQTSNQNDHPLPTGNGLDGFVFALAPDGRELLYTAKPAGDATPTGEDSLFNTLYVLNVSDPAAQPVRLLDNILTADWVPDQPYTFSYSTLTPRDQLPGYQALNDLFMVRIDDKGSQKIVRAKALVKSGPTGTYGAWGTTFKWSPDGKRIAWAQADGVGLIVFDNGEKINFDNSAKPGKFQKLLDFPVYSTALSLSWVWKPTISWSPDGTLIATTIHGKQLQGEPEDTSPVFDLTIAQIGGLFSVALVSQAGMWAAPSYSPLLQDSFGNLFGYIAYLKARTPINSLSGDYDLVIADRDGANAEVIFPTKDQPGLTPVKNRFGDVVEWGPDGHSVAFIHEGDLWIVDVMTKRANRITYTGDAHHPQWVK
ncbi:MAG TPA: G5 domain-containing protein [Aggregatilineales bacterium]|nr:G5 domain-containing protein [Aggregatilineales bacterium]